MEPGEEAALVHRAQRGERVAFLTLLRHYDRSVHRIIYALVRESERAGALTHETFVRAWKGIQHIPTGQTFYPWLMRLARGLAISQARRSIPAIDPGMRELVGGGEAREGGADPMITDPARRCARGFSQLNIDQQTILALRVVEKLSYAEIAKTLDIPIGATLSRLAAARAALMASLAAPGGEAA